MNGYQETRFWGAGGRWAGEQLLKALNSPSGFRGFTTESLRTLDSLRKDEWKYFDEVLIEEGKIRLRGVAALMAANLVKTVPNGIGKTIFEWEKVSDLSAAQTSMDGITRTENDAPDFSLAQLPLPVTHKDFFINLRKLAASRERGEPLDTMQARVAARKVAEQLESMLFSGGKTFGGLSIPGLLTHASRNTANFGNTDKPWTDAAKTGLDMLADLQTMIAGLEADRFYGPYWLFVPTTTGTVLNNDFKTYGDKSIRQRLLEVENLQQIIVADQLTADNLVLVQATEDVVAWVEGEPIQSIQWDIEGGFQINMKAFTIGVPLIRSDYSGRSGVFHMS